MKQTALEEIEFEPTCEVTANSDLRQAYRIPAEAIGKVAIEIYGTKFNAVDVGPSGIGILINYDGLFSANEDLGGINITIGVKKYTLKGTVIHVTPLDINQFHCGISLSSLYKDEKPAFEKAVYDLRKRIFPENERTF